MQLKQKTVDGTTVRLHKIDGKKLVNRDNAYRVDVDGEQIGPVTPRKTEAMDLFQRVVGNLQTNGRAKTRTMDETAGANAYQGGHVSARAGWDLERGI